MRNLLYPSVLASALLALTGCIIESELDADDAAVDARVDARPDQRVPDAGTGGSGGGFGGQGGGGGEADAGRGGAGGGLADAGSGGVGGGADAGSGGAGGGVGGSGGGTGGGGGESGTCEYECIRLGECSVEFCDGIDAEAEEGFVEGCLETCAANPALAALAASQAECQGLVSTLRAVSADYNDACDGAPEPEPEPADDTEPLGPVNDLGPTARITFLTVPVDSESAQAVGCSVVGARRGSALSGLLGLLGGESLADLVSRDAEGEIRLVSFLRLDGWEAGETGNSAGDVELQLLPGLESEAGFVIQRAAYVDGDPMNPPISRLSATLDDAQLRSIEPGSVTMMLPLLGGVDMVIPLTQASAYGELRVAREGFNLRDSTLEGYLTRDGLAQMVAQIYRGCERPEPPALCDQLQGIAPTANDALVLLEGLIGYDVSFDGRGVPRECNADCTATGVCFQIEATGTDVLGIED